jgi:serine/threonine protein phosphatase PrpC
MKPIFPPLSFGALDVAACSLRGAGPRLRDENQDNVVLIDHAGNTQHLHDGALVAGKLPHWPPGHARLAVLDGMGGHGHGREAAEAAAAGLLAMPACLDAAALARHLDVLHADLQRHFAGAAGPRPGTTLTLLECPPGAAPLLYHVGDSRLYEISGPGVVPLTVDHVPATAWAMDGLLDEARWWQGVHAEHRPQVAQAFILGNTFADPSRLSDALFELGPDNLPSWLAGLGDRRALPLRAGACYLLATDGLWSCTDPYGWVSGWPALLAGAAGTAGAAGRDAAAMLAALLDAYDAHPSTFYYPDNVSAILVRVPDAGGAGTAGRDETALPAG